ncbi:MAG: non-heme iron oxygenase ferredoxin subunit [Thiohalobacterales bacterium]
MSDWVDVAATETFDEGIVQLVDVEGTEVAVFNVDGEFFAIEDICTHDGGTLAEGDVEGYEIECPRHGARFDLRTGKVTAPPAYEDVNTFAVRIHHGMVQVRDVRPG